MGKGKAWVCPLQLNEVFQPELFMRIVFELSRGRNVRDEQLRSPLVLPIRRRLEVGAARHRGGPHRWRIITYKWRAS
jgi:hypothetical protein